MTVRANVSYLSNLSVDCSFYIRPKYNLIVSQAIFRFLKRDAFYFRHWTVVHVRLFSDTGHVITKIDLEEPTKIKTCMYTVCWGLNI